MIIVFNQGKKWITLSKKLTVIVTLFESMYSNQFTLLYVGDLLSKLDVYESLPTCIRQ